jgi:threonine/homoserine/homoserine lactone efflux protein
MYMPSFPRLATFFVASLAVVVVPGPNFLYILTRGTTQGRRAALFSTAGLGLGVILHTVLIAAGLSALLASSPLAFQVVKITGGAYLIFLGVQKVRQRDSLSLKQRHHSTDAPALVGQSVVMSITNPKTALFFLTFLPQFVDTESGRVFGQMLVFGAVHMSLTVIVYATLSFLVGGVGSWFMQKPEAADRLRWVAGAMFVGLGVASLVTG